MNCPKCKNPNQPGALYCQVCYEILAHDAVRHHYAGSRSEQTDDQPMTAGQLVKFAGRSSGTVLRMLWKRTWYSRPGRIAIAVGVAALGLAAAFHLVFGTRLFKGNPRLVYRFPPQVSYRYLVGFHCDAKLHSERQGRLDTPMPSDRSDETGSVILQAGPAGATGPTVNLQVQEWIRAQETDNGTTTQTIPATDPSLKPASMGLDKEGSLLPSPSAPSLRTGRILPFLLPHWPKGPHRKGDRWEEPVEWVEIIGDWKIFWQGRLQWTLKDFETQFDVPCILLQYDAALTPHLWNAPDWAKGAKTVRFSGSGKGKAFFDTRENQLLSNSFSYDGTLTLPIRDLSRIPWEERVGRIGSAEAGDIVIQLANRLSIRGSRR